MTNRLPLKGKGGFIVSNLGPPFRLEYNGSIFETCDLCKAKSAVYDVLDKEGYCVKFICSDSCFNLWLFQEGMDING
jgi:hypothetical protein